MNHFYPIGSFGLQIFSFAYGEFNFINIDGRRAVE